MLPLTQIEIINQVYGANTLDREEKILVRSLLVWLDNNTIVMLKPKKSASLRNTIKKAILETVEQDYKINLDEFSSQSRKHSLVFIRSLAYYTFQSMTGATQTEVMEAFGNKRQRSTYINMRDKIINLSETYPEYQQRFIEFQEKVQKKLGNITLTKSEKI